MKQVLFTIIGSLMLVTGVVASGNLSEKKSASITIVKKAVASCNFATVRGHRKGSGTSLTWSMDGVGAVKFKVARTYDFDPYDPYAVWEEVATLDADNSRSYKVDDTNVFPGTINYRIVALMSDGTSVTSPLTAIRITKR